MGCVAAMVGVRGALATALFAAASVAPIAPVRAQEPGAPRDAVLRGTLYDAAGQPVAGSRVLVRVADGTEVFVSAPSDAAGHYEVAIPSGHAYDVVAVVSATGARIELPELEQLQAGEHDVIMPVALGPRPRHGSEELGGADRLFLSFVEDPALVARRYIEGRADYLDFEGIDALTLGALAAVQFATLPQVEFGLRAGYTSVSIDGAPDESGISDLDLWGKLHVYRSPTARFDLAVGALATLPTGDEDTGFASDAIQSKLFVAGSYGFSTAALVGHVGVRVTEDGEAAGTPLDGTVSPTLGLGFVAPATPRISVVIEAIYEGERFEDSREDGRIASGVNWRLGSRGLLRAFASVGIVDEAPDAQLSGGYAWHF